MKMIITIPINDDRNIMLYQANFNISSSENGTVFLSLEFLDVLKNNLQVVWSHVFQLGFFHFKDTLTVV